MHLRSVLGSSFMLLGLVQPAISQSHPGFAHERDVLTRFYSGRQALWSGNALVGVEFDRTQTPRIFAIDREGHREDIYLDLPDAATIAVSSYACGFDGALAMVGYAWSADQRLAHFLIWISPDRKNRTVVQVSPYVPCEVAIAGDGSIWTVGGMRNNNPDRSKASGPVLRRFDASGKLLTSFPVRSRAWSRIAPDSASLSHLFASRDRVGWFTNGCEYIEFSLSGEIIARFDGPAALDNDHISGIALDSQNRLFVGNPQDTGFQVLMLDRVMRTWGPVQLRGPNTPRWARIMGFDGTTLVTTEDGVIRRRVRVDDSELPSSEPKP